MALRQRKNGAYIEVGGLSHRIDEQTKPLSALYQYRDGKMLPVWEAGNFRTADGMIFQTADNKIFNVTI